MSSPQIEQPRTQSNRILTSIRTVLEISATVSVLAVCSVALSEWRSSTAERSAGARPTATRSPGVPAPLPSEPVSLVGAPIRGASTATVAMIVYSDFECPFCARFAAQILPQLDREYISAGKIRLLFRHLPLEQIHRRAVGAALGAACAQAQGRFWEMHDLLFVDRKKLDRANVIQYAQGLKLNMTAFSSCLRDEAPAHVRLDQENATKLGLRGTPAFLIGTVQADGRLKVTGRLSGARPMEEFRRALDDAFASAVRVSRP